MKYSATSNQAIKLPTAVKIMFHGLVDAIWQRPLNHRDDEISECPYQADEGSAGESRALSVCTVYIP